MIFGRGAAIFFLFNQSSDIMNLKRKGEVELEAIYAGAPKGVTYTIVRPGGLTDGPVVGPKGETGRQLFSRTDEFCF